MKTILIFLSISFCFTSFAKTIEITEVIQKGQIKVITNYQHLGKKGMELKISNLTPQTFTISISEGTIFLPQALDEQPLLNIENEIFALKGNETKSVLVGAYCLNLDKLAPNYKTHFEIEKTKDKNILALLDFFKTKKPSEENFQDAIWAIKNNSSISNIEPEKEADWELRQFIAESTNRTDPWFTNRSETIAEAGTPIQRNSISIDGMLKVKFDRDVYFEIVVIDLTTQQVKRTFSKSGGMKMEKDWEHELGFNLKVEGWEKGNYEVVVRDSIDKTVIKGFPFEI